jgi:Flp pilus assembly protein TadG
VQLLVILVPVLFGLMGFALDLGQLYLVRGELQSAANAMALAAAQQLIGTEASTDAATTFARLTLDNTTGQANKYYFGGLQIGQTNGLLNSEAPDPGYYATVVDAIGADSAGGGEVTGSGAKHVRVTLTADAPLPA